MTEKKIKVIYIVSGLGHSGSTLLNLILGTDKKSFAVSELKNFHRNINGKTAECDCKKKATECPIWSPIIKNNKKSNLMRNEDTTKFQIKTFFRLLLYRNHKWKKYDDDKLYQDILEQAKKTKSKEVDCIIDSSKNLKRLMYISTLKNIDLKVIFLTRDGRAVHNSWEKLHSLKKNKIWCRKLFHWMFKTYLINKFVNKNIPRKNLIKLSYDKFAKNPEEHIQKINKKFGMHIEYNNLTTKINAEKYHNLGGNNMRKKQFRGIKYDQSWKKRMPKWKRAILTIICYIPNKKFVYNKKQKPY